MSSGKFVNFKLAGGASAQILGLMNAIYISQKFRIPFKISYYPYSTGTYWPCILKNFLNEHEIYDLNIKTKGIPEKYDLEVGQIILDHPLLQKTLTKERILSLLRNTNILPKLEFFKREIGIHGEPKRLQKINSYYRSISGGFAVINDIEVNQEMHQRFINAGFDSPFMNSFNKENIIIHYRLGDKRGTPMYPKDFNSELLIDPISYVEMIKDLDLSKYGDLYVVSDEPSSAQKLLKHVGLNVKIKETNGNFWKDLQFMSQSQLFIGSSSTVSRLVNILMEHHSSKSIMLNVPLNMRDLSFKHTKYFKSKYIPTTSAEYSLTFQLEKNSHSSYKI